MPVMAKMLTLLRASVREIGEGVINANASQLLEQELSDARVRLQDARRDLASLMAQQPALARQMEALRGELARQELEAVQALQRGDAARAEALSDQVGQIEAEMERHQQSQAEQTAQVEHMKALLRDAEAQLRELERELAMARAAESVQRAAQSVAASGVQRDGARAALRRLQARNQQMDDRMQAERELHAELHPEPSPSQAERRQQVLDRLRARAAEPVKPKA